MRLYILSLNPDDGKALNELWRDTYDCCGITLDQFMESTQRGHLLPQTELPPGFRAAARRSGEERAKLIRLRTVILLGQEVAEAVWHPGKAFEWVDSWAMIPDDLKNPARNQIQRLAVGQLMADALQDAGLYIPSGTP